MHDLVRLFSQSMKTEVTKPVYHDLWGYPVNWTDPSDGWDEEMRKSMIDLTNYVIHQSGTLPAATELGYKKMTIPDELYEAILEARRPETLNWEKCVPSPYTNCLAIRKADGVVSQVPKHNVQIMRVKNEKVLRQSLVSHLKPIIEEWAGQSMSSQVVVYGIRRYLKGAWLSLHVDQVPTHIFSLILQIDQKVEREWPLLVIDHLGARRKIFLAPGEMLLYESAKLPHGRQFPFRGDFFDNLFVHFRPLKAQ